MSLQSWAWLSDRCGRSSGWWFPLALFGLFAAIMIASAVIAWLWHHWVLTLLGLTVLFLAAWYFIPWQKERRRRWNELVEARRAETEIPPAPVTVIKAQPDRPFQPKK